MTFFIILLLIVVLWPWITKWVKGFVSRRAEDTIRRMMGMPTRKEEERLRKEREQRRNNAYADQARTTAESKHEAARREAVMAMKEYAVDVEYIEIREDVKSEK